MWSNLACIMQHNMNGKIVGKHTLAACRCCCCWCSCCRHGRQDAIIPSQYTQRTINKENKLEREAVPLSHYRQLEFLYGSRNSNCIKTVQQTFFAWLAFFSKACRCIYANWKNRLVICHQISMNSMSWICQWSSLNKYAHKYSLNTQ